MSIKDDLNELLAELEKYSDEINRLAKKTLNIGARVRGFMVIVLFVVLDKIKGGAISNELNALVPQVIANFAHFGEKAQETEDILTSWEGIIKEQQEGYIKMVKIVTANSLEKGDDDVAH